MFRGKSPSAGGWTPTIQRLERWKPLLCHFLSENDSTQAASAGVRDISSTLALKPLGGPPATPRRLRAPPERTSVSAPRSHRMMKSTTDVSSTIYTKAWDWLVSAAWHIVGHFGT